MGWQADRDPKPGQGPDAGSRLPEPLAGFGHDGRWDAAPPSAALAAALEEAAGPDGLYPDGDTDDQGYAVGHGIARARRGSGQHTQPPGPGSRGLPARINVTVTETRLHQLAAQATQPRSGAPPGDWELAPRTTDTWTLTLPGGRELAVRFDVVPTHDCDHRNEVGTYVPSERLRRLIQVRDHECTFPPCSRPARESDFEHGAP